MPPKVDTGAIAESISKRIRAAAQQQLHEARLTKTAAIRSQRTRVINELVDIEAELRRLAPQDRADVERRAGRDFAVPEQFGLILKEASVEALNDLNVYWMVFFGALGI